MYIIKTLDFYPENLSFTYKGKKNKKTVIGGLLSILSLIIFLIFGLIIGKDIYQRQNPKVVQYEKEDELTPTTRVNNKTIKLGFSISKNATLFWDESLIRIYPILYIQRYNKQNKLIYKEHLLELEDCKKTGNEPLFYHKCIKNMDFYLSGSWGEDILSYLQFRIMKCSNKTFEGSTLLNTKDDIMLMDELEKNMNKVHISNIRSKRKNDLDLNLHEYLKEYEKKRDKKKITCKSPSEIRETLSNNYWINIYNQYVESNPTNFSNPLLRTQHLDWFIFGNDFYKYVDFYFQDYSLATDNGIIFEEIFVEENEIGITNFHPDFVFKNDTDVLLNLNFLMSKKMKITARSYIKLQTIFANLGGFINLTMIFFKLIIYPFFDKRNNLEIINEFFDLQINNEYYEENSFKRSFKENKDLEIKESKNLNDFSKGINKDREMNSFNLKDSKELKEKENNDLKINKIDNGKKDILGSNRLELLDNIQFNTINERNNIDNLNKGNKSPLNNSSINCFYKQDQENNKEFEDDKERKKDQKINEESQKIKISEELKDKKLFTRGEVFRSAYGLICKNKKLLKKDEAYRKAFKNIFKITDFLQIVKLNKEFKALKYLLLNNIQQKSLEFINNLKIDKEGFGYEEPDYPEIMQSDFSKFEFLRIFKNYFEMRVESSKMTKVDEKLYKIINEKFKKIMKCIDD